MFSCIAIVQYATIALNHFGRNLDRMEEDKVMRAEDVMKELNVSRATLHRLVRSGVINPIEKKNPLLKRPKAFTFLSSEVQRVKTNPPDRKA
jgi:hypothetical protein